MPRMPKWEKDAREEKESNKEEMPKPRFVLKTWQLGIQFPKNVVPTPCGRRTSSYTIQTPHGMVRKERVVDLTGIDLGGN